MKNSKKIFLAAVMLTGFYLILRTSMKTSFNLHDLKESLKKVSFEENRLECE